MPKKNKSFEESLKRLQEISEILESDEASLEDSIKLYEEGITLSKNCYNLLNDADLKVEKLNTQLKEDFE